MKGRPNPPLQRTRHSVHRITQARGGPLSFTFGSRTVSYNPPRHSGVGFRRDF
jgi:hypothetical protein